jgi:hypothetical protein
MGETFIKLKRSADTLELLKYPNAFALATLIAIRANRREPDFSAYSLEPGEALIGDYESCGLTEGQYRWAKEILKRGNIVTFRATNKGTIAKLVNSNIFDINIELNDGQSIKPTTGRRQANDGQATTNKNIKEIKESKINANADSNQEKAESGSLLGERYEPPPEQWEGLKEKLGKIGAME